MQNEQPDKSPQGIDLVQMLAEGRLPRREWLHRGNIDIAFVQLVVSDISQLAKSIDFVIEQSTRFPVTVSHVFGDCLIFYVAAETPDEISRRSEDLMRFCEQCVSDLNKFVRIGIARIDNAAIRMNGGESAGFFEALLFPQALDLFAKVREIRRGRIERI